MSNSRRSYIIAAELAFPRNRVSQVDITEELVKIWPKQEKIVRKIFSNTGVESRNLAMELSKYKDLTDFGERNRLWTNEALRLVEMSCKKLLEKVDLAPSEIDVLIDTTVTGLAIPALGARLMNKLPFSRQAKRIPLFGLGCLGGVAGIARAHDYLVGHPDQAVLFFAVELCSLTFQFGDEGTANIVGSGLFADGAASILMVGEEHPLAKVSKLAVRNSASNFYPETERVMGWDISSSGFNIVLSGNVPEVVEENIPKDVQAFLKSNDLDIKDIQEVISHPGGPKVLDALAKAVQKDREFFRHSWDSLKDNGNMSSVSVLDVLSRSLGDEQKVGTKGLMLAMGPAFCSEMVLTERV
jgi:alkylresorcinol/alkylpyrone synthase